MTALLFLLCTIHPGVPSFCCLHRVHRDLTLGTLCGWPASPQLPYPWISTSLRAACCSRMALYTVLGSGLTEAEEAELVVVAMVVAVVVVVVVAVVAVVVGAQTYSAVWMSP